MRAIRLLALVLALAPTAFGCGDDIKFPDPTVLPDPALNGVFPAKGFTDRALRVEVSGDGTTFDTASTVAFGAGITVGTVEVSSTGTLFANITIAGDAALGKRDVVVTNGADSLTLTAAFDVQNPLEIAVDGPQLQGGVGSLAIINHDPENPFLGDLTIDAGNGTTILVNEQTEFTAFATVLYDTDAVTGALVVTDTLLDTVTSRGGDLTVTPRTATALTAPGKGPSFLASNAMLTNTTALFSFTGVSALYRGSASIANANNAPPIVIWLVNGKWAQARGFQEDDLIPTTNNQNMFVVVFDGFTTGTVFDLAVDEFHALPGVTALAEVEDNDFFTGTPQVIAAPETLFTGVLENGGDFDDILVTIADGESIRVTSTMGFGGFADTLVQIFLADFADLVVENDDISISTGLFASDVNSGPLPAGTYIIEVSAPFGAFEDDYELGVSVLPANNN